MNSAFLAALLLGSFALGSIPFGILVGRTLFATDIRSAGSGNIGAANALRAFGKGGAALVLVLDAIKGAVPVLVVGALASPEAAAGAGLLAMLGHCYSPWLRGRGGKGVATWLGALGALSWIAGIVFVGVWLALVVPTRYSSLGSLGASILSVLALRFATGDWWIAACGAVAALVIIIKHRENILRLREGRENKIVLRRTNVAAGAGN